jgi:hypothetical protein
MAESMTINIHPVCELSKVMYNALKDYMIASEHPVTLAEVEIAIFLLHDALREMNPLVSGEKVN